MEFKFKIQPDTIARTIVLVLALVNQALAIFGKEALPFTEDQVYQGGHARCDHCRLGVGLVEEQQLHAGGAGCRYVS